jgi:S1-C subfamily serine protease
MRIRKSGRQREIPVTVGARRDSTRVTMVLRAPPAPPTPRLLDGEFMVRTRAPMSPTPPAPPVNAMLSGTGVAVLAGAQFSTIDQDFASALDLDAGVLVLRVPPGTPAAEAGLRAGEVVVRANGLRVRDVATLRRVLVDATSEVRLVVQGKGSNERTVVLKLR